MCLLTAHNGNCVITLPGLRALGLQAEIIARHMVRVVEAGKGRS